MTIIRRALVVFWALPNTLLGLMLGLPALFSGGGCRYIGGVLEFYGGATAWLLRRGFLGNGILAMTLGHVILGINAVGLDRARAHESVHVRQYECWGPIFLPAYLLSSLWIYLRGGRPYLDNPFEREAYAAAPLDEY